MNKYRSELRFDPRCPVRPLRVLPTGRVVEDNDESKSFRKWAYDMDIPIRLVDNPKTSGSESFKRYNRYQSARTLREIVELSTTAKSSAKRREQQVKARQDIVNDYLRGYIIFVNHEIPEPTHFVSAADVAHANGTMNVHALYSQHELDDARDAHITQQELKKTALFSQFEAKGFLTFQEQITYLWGDEPKSRLNDGEGGTLSERECYAMYGEILNGVASPEPVHFKHATDTRNPEHQLWNDAIKRERSMLESQGTWVMVPRDSIGHHKLVKCKYVFKRKLLKSKEIQYKARLVACGYSQVAGESFSLDELYASVVAYSSMRFLLSYGCQKGMLLSQCDISSAYLQSHLEEDVYMAVPPDMFIDGKPPRDKDGRELCLKLKRGLRRSTLWISWRIHLRKLYLSRRLPNFGT